MPTDKKTDITLPDGTLLSGVPVDSTPQDIVAKLREKGYDVSKLGNDWSPWEGVKRGAMDPIDASAQLLQRSLPDPVVARINALNDLFASAGLVAPTPKEGWDAQRDREEQIYQLQRAAAQPPQNPDRPDLPGDETTDWGRLAGNVLSPANLALVGRGLPAAAGLAKAAVPKAAAEWAAAHGMSPVAKALSTLGGGAAIGMTTQPVTSTMEETARGIPADFAIEKTKQAGAGMGGAVLGVAGGKLLGKIVHPTPPAGVDMLKAAGVRMTPGEMAGPAASRIEEASTSFPILGGSVANARRRAVEDFNTAVGNEVLKPIGEQVPLTVNPGHELIDYVGNKIGDAYNSLLPNLSAKLDTPARQQLSQLRMGMRSAPKEYWKQFDNIVQNEIYDRFTPTGGLANGQTLKNIESKLGNMSRGYAKTLAHSYDYDKATLLGAVRQAQAIVRDMVERQNPGYAGQLQPINHAWSMLVRMEDAAGRQGAKEGVFSPNHLVAAVKRQDLSPRKRSLHAGKNELYNMAEAGDRILGAHVPDSGTALRSLTAAGGLLGGYLLHPMVGIGEAAAMLPYTRPGQKAAQALLTGRQTPEAAAISKFLGQTAPMYSVPGLSQLFEDQ